MKINKLPIIVLLALTLSAVGQDTPEERNLASYEFTTSVGWGSTLSRLFKAYPKAAQVGKTETKGDIEVEIWRVRLLGTEPPLPDLGWAECVDFKYANGKLFEFLITSGKLSWKELLTQLADKYGEPEKVKYKEPEKLTEWQKRVGITYYSWWFPKLDKVILLEPVGDGILSPVVTYRDCHIAVLILQAEPKKTPGF